MPSADKKLLPTFPTSRWIRILYSKINRHITLSKVVNNLMMLYIGTAVVGSIIFSELIKLTTTFIRKVRIVTQSKFSRKVWFQVFISQRIFPKTYFSTQSLSTKFGSVFNFPAKFFGNNFNKFLSEK